MQGSTWCQKFGQKRQCSYHGESGHRKWLRRWEQCRKILFLNRKSEECQVMHLLQAMGEEAEDIAYRVFEDTSDLQDYMKVVEILSHFKAEIDVVYKLRNIFVWAG